MNNKKFIIFTDGACLNNGKKNSIGAIGIYFKENDTDNLGQIVENDNNKITNQTMELLAVIKAMQIIDSKIQNKIINEPIIYIYTDSTYVINSLTKWYPNWEKNNWLNTKQKPVENKELIQLLYTLKNKYIVIFKHVRSHQKEPEDKKSESYQIWYGNYMADYLATNACKIFIKDKQR
jgi:ribonuclease HI